MTNIARSSYVRSWPRDALKYALSAKTEVTCLATPVEQGPVTSHPNTTSSTTRTSLGVGGTPILESADNPVITVAGGEG